jgi:hypothetical protein
MLETLITPLSRRILACAALLGAVALSVDASAQMNPGPPPSQGGAAVNPMCPRLEAQLASIDRGGGSGDPAKEEQIRRYQDAASKQQGELDRVTSQAKRMGCDSSGFFSLFSASRRNAVRSTTRSSRFAPIWIRSPPASSGCAAAA